MAGNESATRMRRLAGDVGEKKNIEKKKPERKKMDKTMKLD
jgi:hypothetical protein